MTPITLATRSASQCAPKFGSVLHVKRTDINFTNRLPDLVDIHIVVTNIGVECSDPTYAALSAAPLGAFVPWHPLAMIPVSGLAPSESFVVRAQARQRRRQPLGTPDRVTPRQLLVALDGDGDDRPTRRWGAGVVKILAPFLRQPAGSMVGSATEELATRELPADPFDLLLRRNPHWAGNLNIFIGGRAVERHMAQSLRVYPGRSNMAFFIVGTGPDAYAFDLKGAAAEWDAALFDLTQSRSLLPGGRGSVVPLDRWVELSGHAMMILALHPPTICSRETVEVHVKQRSTSEIAVVEFSLDSKAAGPGCYVV